MDITIFSLLPDDAQRLSAMLLNDRPDYSQHFLPFAFDAASLQARLQKAERDRYWGVAVEDALAGFFHAARLR